MKDIEKIQEMSTDEKKEYLKEVGKNYADHRLGMQLSAICMVPVILAGLTSVIDPNVSLQTAILCTSIYCSIPAIHAVYHGILMIKYGKQYIKHYKEIKKEELESYEDKKSKEKIKEIEVGNNINYNIKQGEIEKKILSISEKELGLEKKKELLNLYKDNIEKFNKLYEAYEISDYLNKKGYSSSEIEYLIGEIEDTRTTEKAYQMKFKTKAKRNSQKY